MTKPTIPEILDRFVDYFEAPGNGAWGSLHNVLDDGNVDDSHVDFSISHADAHGDEEGADLGRILLRMSRTQRLKLPGAVQKAIATRRADAAPQP